jgi:acyl carrier protein
MELTAAITPETVKAIVVETLGVQERADSLDEATPLLGSLPELDSMAVLELLVAFEQRFGLEIDGEDVRAEAFETLGTLTAFMQSQER